MQETLVKGVILKVEMNENKISAIVIAKNSEDIIEDCLKSLKFCDEIIVVDNGSADKTKEKAEKFHAKVIESKEDNFSNLRNIGLKHVKGDWVLYVDTDERVSESLKDEILKSLENNDFSAFKIKRKNFYFGNYSWPKIEDLERLFKREKLKEWYGILHESPKVEGKVGELNGYLLHYTHKNLTEMLNKTIEWSTYESKLRYDAGHPKMTWWRFFRVIISGFWDSYVTQGGWKAGTPGLIESLYQGFSLFITYAKLWELQREHK